MKIVPIEPIGFESNSYLVIENGTAMLIDAGAPTKTVEKALRAENATLSCIVLTHAHFDHTISAAPLAERCACPIYVSEQDREMLGDPSKNGMTHLFGYGKATDFSTLDVRMLESELRFAGLPMRVLHTPGHSKGSCCLEIGHALFSGDTLFDGGFGRYDLYGGDAITLKNSLQTLRSLDSELALYPGHGEMSKLGDALSQIAFFIS